MIDDRSDTYDETIPMLDVRLVADPAAVEMPRPGTELGGYRIISLLGEGGMGCVYLAEHMRLGRRVALKMLRPQCAANPVNLERFFSEAKAVNQIAHEHIIEITDFVDDQASKFYIMEVLEGLSLFELLTLEGVPALGRTLRIAIQMCEGLHAAHQAGVVHRDLKPANIFLTTRAGQRDFVKLLDFGIAKLTDVPDGESLHKTAAGVLLGTPDYMSPEQAGGLATIDRRSDVYSLGVILYEMVTGQRPFQAKSCAELLVKHMSESPVSPAEVTGRPHHLPPALTELILDCLAKDPAGRPQTMAMLSCRLTAILEGLIDVALEPVPAAPAAVPQSTSYQSFAPMASSSPPIREVAPMASLAGGVVTFDAGPSAALPRFLAGFVLTALVGVGGLLLWNQHTQAPVDPLTAAALDITPQPRPDPTPTSVAATPTNVMTRAPPPDVVATPAVVSTPEAETVAPSRRLKRSRRAKSASGKSRRRRSAKKKLAEKRATQVRLSIVTDPPGVQVYLRGDLVGVTPIVERYERSNAASTFVLKRAGYETTKRTIAFDGDRRLDVEMQRDDPPPKKRTDPAAPAADVLLDPFAGG